MLNLAHKGNIRDGHRHVFLFPLAKLQVFLYTRLTTASLVIQPSSRKIFLLLPSPRADQAQDPFLLELPLV